MLLSKETLTPLSAYLRRGELKCTPRMLNFTSFPYQPKGRRCYTGTKILQFKSSLRSSASAGLPSSLSMVVDPVVGRDLTCLGVVVINIVLPFLFASSCDIFTCAVVCPFAWHLLGIIPHARGAIPGVLYCIICTYLMHEALLGGSCLFFLVVPCLIASLP